jgi:putative endonuclease
MASVYILYSSKLKKYYVGSCKEMNERIELHLSKYFPGAFTENANDWILYFAIADIEYEQARKIELHIKRMKSKVHIENLKKYPEMVTRLISLYER